MIGTVCGDIIGSGFELSGNKAERSFELFTSRCRYTDNTVLTAAVCEALMESDLKNPAEVSGNTRLMLQKYRRMYPCAGYGSGFIRWLDSIGAPCESYGNGAGMQVAPVAWAASTMEEALKLCDSVTTVTHNHPEGRKGAHAVMAAVFLARQGEDKEQIRQSIQQRFCLLDFTLEEITDFYEPSVSCQGTVPDAIVCFLESDSFEGAIRNAVGLGGNTGTLAAMTGAVAEAYYGVPPEIRENVMRYFDRDEKSHRLKDVFQRFESRYPCIPGSLRNTPSSLDKGLI